MKQKLIPKFQNTVGAIQNIFNDKRPNFLINIQKYSLIPKNNRQTKTQQLKYPISDDKLDYDELKKRQAFMESEFNPQAKSPAGAMGTYQIMNSVFDDYKAKKDPKETRSLYDPALNELVRDWHFAQLQARSWINKPTSHPSVQYAKALAAYNWGPGNLIKSLNQAKQNGIDIDNSLEWIDLLPLETKNYISFILLGKDVNKAKNNKRYKNALSYVQ